MAPPLAPVQNMTGTQAHNGNASPVNEACQDDSRERVEVGQEGNAGMRGRVEGITNATNHVEGVAGTAPTARVQPGRKRKYPNQEMTEGGEYIPWPGELTLMSISLAISCVSHQ